MAMTDLAAAEAGPRETRSRPQTARKTHYQLASVAGALLFAVWALLSGWTQPVTGVDLEQGRLNVAVAPPAGDEAIVQTFRSRHDGLSQVEVLLAQAGAPQEGEGRLAMRLLDDTGAVVAEQAWSVGELRHNQALTLRFAAQPNSKHRLYRLALDGQGPNTFGAWAYDLDVVTDGELTSSDDVRGDLRFSTRYRLSLAAALRTLVAMLRADGAILLLSMLLVPLPGCIALLAGQRRLPAIEVGAWWSLATALGLALWPLLWLWLTVAGGRWTRGALAATLGVGWALVLILWLRSRRHRPVWRRAARFPDAAHMALLLLLAVGLGARLLAVRDLAFPPWVDSSRHGLITMVMEESGRAPDGYRPFLEVDNFTYHFGFHSLAAGVQMLGRETLPRTLLVLGQLLNVGAALSVYGAAWLLTRRRDAALVAAFLVALPFFFPAYYATWGRFTQLTGALALAPLLALTWLLARGASGWRRAWWLVGVLAAGLFLIHVRVFLVYLPFAFLAWLVGGARNRRRASATRGLGAAALLALALASPHLWRLTTGAPAGSGYLAPSGQSYAAFPAGYATVGWERWFLVLGGAAFMGLALAAWRGQRRALAGVTLAGWAALVALLLSGRVPGVPLLWLINLNSAYILVFVPLSLLLALAFASFWPWVLRRAVLAVATAFLLGAGLAAGTLFGVQQQVTIVNETTILARPADVAGLRWVAERLSPHALLAVNSWRWLGETWAAADGGAWLLPLSGHQATTPPVDYIGNRRLFQRVIDFNEGATAIDDWAAPSAAAWLAQRDVTHVFIGARGGYLDPAALARNPQLEMIYGRDGVFVFEVGERGEHRD